MGRYSHVSSDSDSGLSDLEGSIDDDDSLNDSISSVTGAGSVASSTHGTIHYTILQVFSLHIFLCHVYSPGVACWHDMFERVCGQEACAVFFFVL